MGKRAKFLASLLESSEMCCSLRYEDVRGCPYNMFDTREIAAFSTASSLFAFLSLLIAA